MKECYFCLETKDLSEFYETPKRGSEHSTYCKTCIAKHTSYRQYIFKKKCVEYLGGKCSECNYKRSIAALHFHHKDPTQKDFSISSMCFTSFEKNRDIITAELDKCVILCANCHAIEHNTFDGEGFDEVYKEFRLRAENDREIANQKNVCKCGKRKAAKAIVCIECTRASYPLRQVPIEDVINDIRSTNYTKAGRKYGVSDNALRKFMKRSGYDTKTLTKI